MNIKELYERAKQGTISECPSLGTVTVNRGLSSPDIYRLTGETEKDEQGNEIPVVELETSGREIV